VRSEDDPEIRKAARAAARTRKASGPARPAAAAAATGTLEKDADTGSVDDAGGEPEDTPSEPDVDEPDDTSRRRTTPQGGTAAERAAQRRARMREQGKGEN